MDKQLRETIFPYLKKAFPDLPDDAEIIVVHDNPHYIGGVIGKFHSEPTKVDLKKYNFKTGNADVMIEFTAGVYRVDNMFTNYVAVLLLETKVEDVPALMVAYVPIKDSNATNS